MNMKTWNDISIKQYREIQETISSNLNEIQKMTKLISIVFNLDMETIPIKDALYLLNEIQELVKAPLRPGKIKKTYKLGKYECSPVGFEKMTMSQYMDFLSFAGNGEDHLEDTLAVCLVPIGSKYNDGSYDLEYIKERIPEMAITDAPAICSFFAKRLNKLLKRSLCCLAGQIMLNREMTWKEKKEMIKILPTTLKASDSLIM